MNSFRKRRLMLQGFASLDDLSLRRFGPWLRLAPTVCGIITLTGVVTESWWVLWSLAIVGLIAFERGKHPLDLFYDIVQWLMLRNDHPLPDYPAPRLFSAGLASLWMFASGTAFLLGAVQLGTVLGVLVAGALLLTASTDICIGCLVYHAQHALRATRRIGGRPPQVSGGRMSTRFGISTGPRITALKVKPIRRTSYD